MIKVDPGAKGRRQENVRKGGRPGLTEEKKDAIVTLYNSDMPIKEICNLQQISATTLYRVLRERS